ncbi:SARP family transcriptional regulator [Actinoplanes utahensis]|nr:SARP family transcriptional regulator [Actinoplanes utahensis]
MHIGNGFNPALDRGRYRKQRGIDAMRWRLLGPVGLSDGPEGVDLGTGKQRCLLAALLLTPGQVVPAGTLIDRIWGDSPPRSATPLAPYATRLRRVLDPVPGAGAIRFTAGGYLIDCPADMVDLHRARRLVFTARAAEEAGDDARAAWLLLDALDGWDDESLAGVPGGWAARMRDALGRERLDVLTRLGRCALRLGRAEEVAERLAPFAAEYPTVEALVAVFMDALVAAGRPAQALEAFARTREAIADRLGSEPGPELTGLHTRILRGAAGPAAAGRLRPGAPAQLPADALAFTGRRAELAELDRVLTGSPRLAAVTGPPGVGKSALAVHWGHRARHRFPDGQLYLNLRGFDRGEDVMSPEEAARNLLVALAPGHPVPAGLDARTGLLRSLLAGRRLLIVLDNVRDAAHVRPLLPGAGDCVTVVTSRDRLTGLVASHGALPVPLDALDPGEAGELLAGRLGAGRLAAEPCTVAALVAATAGLPLALVTVAARAAMRAGQTLGELAAEIAESRLTGLGDPELLGDETDPRTVFSWSYRALSPAGQRMFRLLGVNPGPDLSVAAATSLAGCSTPAGGGLGDAVTVAALDELVAASLITRHRPGRYVMHDLLRAYAADLLTATEREPAARRLLDHHLHTGHVAALHLDPQREPLRLAAPAEGVRPESIRGEAAALEWFAAEHAGLMALIRHADGDHGWQLPWVVIDFLDRQGHWDDWVTVERIAVAAARQRGEVRAEALAQRVLARGYVQLGRYDEAEPHYAEAERLYERAGDLVGRAHTLFSLTWLREQQGREQDCLDLTTRALDLYRRAGHRCGEARALNALGWYLGRAGHPELTLRHCEEALRLQRELGDRYGEAAACDSIGWAHHHLGDHDRAVAAYQRALDLYRAAGDLLNEAEIQQHLGDAYAHVGDPSSATAHWRQALALLEKLDHPGAAGLRLKLRSD